MVLLISPSVLKEKNLSMSYEAEAYEYFGHLMQRADLLEKMLGKTEGKGEEGGSQRVRNGAAKGTAAEDGGCLGLRGYERVRLGDRCLGPDWKNPSGERS